MIPALRKLIAQPENPRAPDALWALNAVGGFTQRAALEAMKHPNRNVRIWAVRLLGDPKQSVGSEVATALLSLAQIEPDAQVRSQLASTAKRLPGEESLHILFELMQRIEDVQDPQIPLL